MTIAQQTGQTAENTACDYLQKNGLDLITRNYSCRLGEIDLIMRDKDSLVFVEVRYRNTLKFGGSLQSVTRAKQIKLSRTASFYLQRNKLTNSVACRFDVVGIDTIAGNTSIEWVKNAF